MRKKFAITSNVKRFTAAVNGIMQAPPGIDRMALVYGDPGLGKTETCAWWVNHHGQNAAYVPTKKLMSGRWLLEEIVMELGEAPAYRTCDLFRQAVEILAGTDRLLILDEADYLTRDKAVLETIRDIHDATRSPILLVGMEKADTKLRRHRHLWRRFSEVERFKPLTMEDIAAVFEQICEYPVDSSAVEAVHGFGSVTVSLLYRLCRFMEESVIKHGLDHVTADCVFPGQRSK
ncbi:prophage MuSo1, DNA transposition protein, putative [Desulfatibacillum aliphaticivorans]|uniref:Prophage MuSo1, DNA transposition protein, putative n=1 Tax=Desulfatibacillum aliphaticivorans TaxID=218208 RepID=B8FD27_DESAL|nr:ATP-binding protein [Desulfatibacillum aliphaticivorans]ACL06458.1 prophage MuSo1, DNA transposition protein, putative [Desulfatibacillum aliphaticivorans]